MAIRFRRQESLKMGRLVLCWITDRVLRVNREIIHRRMKEDPGRICRLIIRIRGYRHRLGTRPISILSTDRCLTQVR